ncbi:MAG: alanine--glyoxylate aminotransferase family protein, partial [Nitrospinota bacterium]|nr:alanine--glyoxylate aminotransferase family protein [Nitrospinota bacterium]
LASGALQAGLEGLGLSMFAEAGTRNPTLNTVTVPKGVDEAAVRKSLLDEFNIEIAGGLGILAGKIWRIGMLGSGATQANVVYFLSALEVIFKRMGYIEQVGGAVSAATRVFAEAEA